MFLDLFASLDLKFNLRTILRLISYVLDVVRRKIDDFWLIGTHLLGELTGQNIVVTIGQVAKHKGLLFLIEEKKGDR